MTNATETENRGRYVVVHPLDDEPEQKHDPAGLPLMEMRGSVKMSLLALRMYLIAMMLLVLYRVLQVAGVLGR